MSELEAFVGRWKTAGRVLDDGSVIEGTDSYEWLAGKHFLVHHVDVRMGGEAMQGIEVIGRDAERDAYVAHSFDSQGAHTVMHMTLQDGTWRFGNESMRFSGTFADDGQTITGRWEMRGEDGAWRPWMDVRLTK